MPIDKAMLVVDPMRIGRAVVKTAGKEGKTLLNETRKGQHQERTATRVTPTVQTLVSTGQLPSAPGRQLVRGRRRHPQTGKRTVRTGKCLVRTGRQAARTGQCLPQPCRRLVRIGESPLCILRRQRQERRYAM
jgi:hypothetical protein